MLTMNYSPSLLSVTVIVVTFNSIHCLYKLHPLLKHCPHIVISDNASSDGTVNLAQDLWPQAMMLSHNRNLGFGAANNRALAHVKTQFAFLLNPDCELLPLQLKKLLDASNKFPEAAMLAPQLVDAKGNLEINYRWPSTHWTSRGPAAVGPISVGFVCGAAMLLRMSTTRSTNFFDEDFFLYYEDDDLCLRFFKSGLSIVVIPSVRVLHHSRGSVKGQSPWLNEFGRGYHHAQSKLIFAKKYSGQVAAQRLRRNLMWKTILALPVRVLLFSPNLIARMWGRLVGVFAWQPKAQS